MRTIKFRAWNKKIKRFSYWDIHQMMQTKVMSTQEVNDNEWMQFTGLLDKNGKEIYEGDITSSESHVPKEYHVVFLEGGFCCTNPRVDMWPIDLNHFYPSSGIQIEVIGDIYQNPELCPQN